MLEAPFFVVHVWSRVAGTPCPAASWVGRLSWLPYTAGVFRAFAHALAQWARVAGML